MFEELETQQWALSSSLYTGDFVAEIARECQNRINANKFTQASIGYRSTKTVKTDVRGDFTQWLEETTDSEVERVFMSSLREIMGHINQDFFLNLKSFESHFALYPPGSGYVKHIDNHRGMGARKITFILYLNESWQPGHGGELTMFDPLDPEIQIAQIAPRLGNFVLFRSDIFPHQVEKSFRPRLSVTGWFRNDAL